MKPERISAINVWAWRYENPPPSHEGWHMTATPVGSSAAGELLSQVRAQKHGTSLIIPLARPRHSIPSVTGYSRIPLWADELEINQVSLPDVWTLCETRDARTILHISAGSGPLESLLLGFGAICNGYKDWTIGNDEEALRLWQLI